MSDLGPPAARESLFAAFGVRQLHFVFSPSPDLDWFNAEILGYRLQGLSSELSGIGGEHHLDLIAIGEELPDHFETILTVKMSEKDLCLQRRLCRLDSNHEPPSDLNPTHEPASEGIRNWIPSFELYVRKTRAS